jgi:hypothetical protein
MAEEADTRPDHMKLPEGRNRNVTDKLHAILMALQQQLAAERESVEQVPFINDQGSMRANGTELPLSPSGFASDNTSKEQSDSDSSMVSLNDLFAMSPAIATQLDKPPVLIPFNSSDVCRTMKLVGDALPATESAPKSTEPIESDDDEVIVIEEQATAVATETIKRIIPDAQQREAKESMVASRSGQVSKALTQLNAALSKQPNNQLASIQRSRLMQHQEPWGAVRDLEQVLTASPSNRLARSDLLQVLLENARTFLMDRNWSAAETVLRKLQSHGYANQFINWLHNELDAARQICSML